MNPIQKGLAALTLLAASALPFQAQAETPPSDPVTESVEVKDEGIGVRLSLGVGYRTLAVGDDMHAFFKETVHDPFSPAMPGIEDQVVPGDQLLYLRAEVAVDPKFTLHGHGSSIEFLAGVDFSTSAILPSQRTVEHYDAAIPLGNTGGTLPIGDTVTDWNQTLNAYVVFMLGVEYTPVTVGSDTVSFSPTVRVGAGVSYVDATSRMIIEIIDPEFQTLKKNLGGTEI